MWPRSWVLASGSVKSFSVIRSGFCLLLPQTTRYRVAAVIGLGIVGLVGWVPMVGGLISFVGFGAVMLLSWRVFRGARGAAPYGAGVGPVAEAAG